MRCILLSVTFVTHTKGIIPLTGTAPVATQPALAMIDDVEPRQRPETDEK